MDFRARTKLVWPHFNVFKIRKNPNSICYRLSNGSSLCDRTLYRVINIEYYLILINRHFRINSAEFCG